MTTTFLPFSQSPQQGPAYINFNSCVGTGSASSLEVPSSPTATFTYNHPPRFTSAATGLPHAVATAAPRPDRQVQTDLTCLQIQNMEAKSLNDLKSKQEAITDLNTVRIVGNGGGDCG